MGCVLPLLLLPLVEYRAPLSGLSLSQAVLRSRGIANTNSAHALLLSTRSRELRVQEQVPRGGGGGGSRILLQVASDADTKGAIHVEKGKLITVADPLHSMGDSEKGLGAGQQGEAQASVPYLILAIFSIVAAALLATSPDPTDSLCDTVLETKMALESPCRSRHSRTAETQPLVSATTPRSSGSSRTPVWV